MKIILSPAKKMKVDTDSIDTMSSPVFLEKTEEILGWMQGRTEEELKKLWKCNDKITTENIERIKTMNFQSSLLRQYWHMKGLLINIWHQLYLKMGILIMCRNT